jgi:hypothetical protein
MNTAPWLIKWLLYCAVRKEWEEATLVSQQALESRYLLFSGIQNVSVSNYLFVSM